VSAGFFPVLTSVALAESRWPIAGSNAGSIILIKIAGANASRLSLKTFSCDFAIGASLLRSPIFASLCPSALVQHIGTVFLELFLGAVVVRLS
jgi:hypothetical protein